MSAREDLLVSIADTIQDYRAGQIDKPTPRHVDRWIGQFDEAVQLPMLREMDHVLKRTYFTLEKVTEFLSDVVQAEKLVGKDPSTFWRGVNFLDIQGGGNSQTEMLGIFDEILQEKHGLGIDQCGTENVVYVYLDDAIFTGNRVRSDLVEWINSQARGEETLHIISLALHSGGHYYANTHINKAATASGKSIKVYWWRKMQLESRKCYRDTADLLWPATIPDDVAVEAYVQDMSYPPALRCPGKVGVNDLFSSEEGKSLLEQEFLKAGAQIRQSCPYLGPTQRPLGHMSLDTLGFGSLIITFRNCPNNAPLALWVGDPWYPLFPRATNSDTVIMRMFADLTKGEER